MIFSGYSAADVWASTSRLAPPEGHFRMEKTGFRV
jgi:hypothetical protein